jgi:integrase
MMQTHRAVDPTKILTRSELITVLADLKRKALRSPTTRQNLIIFRLAVCCGLRVSEIAQLQIADVRVESARPHLRIRRGAAKGGKSRIVPLWWDAGTLADLAAWKAERLRLGVEPDAPFVPNRRATQLSRHTLRKRFRTACKVLGRERLDRDLRVSVPRVEAGCALRVLRRGHGRPGWPEGDHERLQLPEHRVVERPDRTSGVSQVDFWTAISRGWRVSHLDIP